MDKFIAENSYDDLIGYEDVIVGLMDAFAAEAVRAAEDRLIRAKVSGAWNDVVSEEEENRARHAAEGERGCSCPPLYHHPACPMRPTP